MRKTVLLAVLLSACATVPEGPASSAPSSQVKAADPDKEVAATLRSITARARKGEAAKLHEQFAEKVRLHPHDWRMQLFAAWCGQPSEASWQDIAKVFKRYPEEPWPLVASGRVYLQWKGFLDQADSEFDKALKLRPGFLPALVGRADALRLRGKLPEAKALYEEVLAKDPEWQEALTGLGLTLLALNDEAAGPTLEKALKLDGDDLAAVTALARLAKQSKDAAKAADLYGRLLQFNPNDREARLALGKLKLDAGDADGAAVEYEAALKLLADVPTAKALVEACRAMKRDDKVLRALEKLALLDPKDPDPYVQIAEIRAHDGDSEGAEGALRNAADRAPEDPVIHFKLARLIAEKEDLVAAIEAYRLAQSKGSDEAGAPLAALEAKAGLGKPIVGDPNRVYNDVSLRLVKLASKLQEKNPGIGGRLKVRVTIGADGKAQQIEMLEDTVHEPALGALVYFSLKDAKYPKKSTPIFEFEVKPAKR